MEFEATIVRLPGKMAWPVFYVPTAFITETGTKGRISVLATIAGGEFRLTLLPSSNGHYVVYNKALREHCGKTLGDTLRVSLEVDSEPRELELPEDVAAALTDSKDAMAKFTSLPYYVRREEVNKINGAKTTPTREKRIKALIDKLILRSS